MRIELHKSKPTLPRRAVASTRAPSDVRTTAWSKTSSGPYSRSRALSVLNSTDRPLRSLIQSLQLHPIFGHAADDDPERDEGEAEQHRGPPSGPAAT